MANAKVQGADGGGLQGKISFSVVIPVFNVEPYLGQCLDSMLPALRAEDEIILALRSSEDGSITIAEHYAQENGNIRLLRQDGIGLSNARNCAVREAYGTYLIYVDSDDRVDTAQFTHALQRIREDTSHRDVYFFDFYHDNHRTGKLEPWFQIGEGGNFQGVENIGKILRQHRCFWNVWRYICRRGFLMQNGITFLENRMSEDVDYTTSVLLARPDTAFYHDPYYLYAVGRGTSLMDRPTLRRLEDTVFVLERSIRRLREAALPYAYMNDLEVLVFRFPNVIGPRLTHGVIFDFVKRLKANPSHLRILGDGTQTKPYIYVLDLVDAIMHFKDAGKGVTLYNVGVETQSSVKRIAEIVCEKMGLTGIPFEYTGGRGGWKGDVPVFAYNLDKIHAAGWSTSMTSDEAVAKTVEAVL